VRRRGSASARGVTTSTARQTADPDAHEPSGPSSSSQSPAHAPTPDAAKPQLTGDEPAADEASDRDAAGEPGEKAAARVRRRHWQPRLRAGVPVGPGNVRPSGKLPGRDPLWARLLVIVGALLVLASSGAVAATKVLANRYDETVRKGSLIAPGARANAGGDEAHGRVTGPLNYLLIGSDARMGEPLSGARSDTIIIVHIPASLDRAYMISIPRDLRVQIPPFPKTGFLGSREKINGAFEYAKGGDDGVQLLSATLSQLVGITFDGAAVIDFGGFEKVVKLLGGVNMCIDERTESQHVGHDRNGKYLAPWYGPDGAYRNYESTPEVYEPGCRHLEPWQALDYSRQRKSLPDGDFGRQRHQQQLLKAIFDEARKQGVVTNPRKTDAMIRSVGQSLTVDTNGVSLADLVYALRDVRPADLVGIKVPSEAQDLGGISYVIPFEAQSDTLYGAIRDDTLDSWVVQNQQWVNGL